MRRSVAGISLAALLLAGCGGRAAVPMAAMRPSEPVTVPFSDEASPDTTTTFHVGVRLTNEASANNVRYGFILGYFKGLTSTTSQTVSVMAGQQIRFKNVDVSLSHTASFLGKATFSSAPWPASFNGSGVQSPAGTAIGTTNFSTGPLSPGHASLLYSTGMPGFYMFGCAFHYNPDKMRTVIIVK